VALVVALLGLVRTPPTVVFVGKLTTATAGDGGMAWLTVAQLVNTLFSLFYYLRWVAPAIRRPDPAAETERPRAWSTRAAVVTAGGSVVLGIVAGPIWTLVDAPLLP
jgi:NADH-quinone oxidoreductase subunit N